MDKWSNNVKGVRGLIFISCILCAYVFAFTSPLKSIAFTLLGALVGVVNFD